MKKRLLVFVLTALALSGCTMGVDMSIDANGLATAKTTISVNKAALNGVNTVEQWKAIVESASSTEGASGSLPNGTNCTSGETEDKSRWTYTCDADSPSNSGDSDDSVSRDKDVVTLTINQSSLDGLTGGGGAGLPEGSPLLAALMQTSFSVTMANATVTEAGAGITGVGTSTATVGAGAATSSAPARIVFKLAQTPTAEASSIAIFQTASSKTGCSFAVRALSKHVGFVTVSNAAQAAIAKAPITTVTGTTKTSGLGDCTTALTATFYPRDFMHVDQSTATPVLGPESLPLSGKFQTGSSVTMSGKWTNATVTGYQWQRDGKAIPGAIKSSYKVAKADKGHSLRLVATLNRGDGLTLPMSSAATKVKK